MSYDCSDHQIPEFASNEERLAYWLSKTPDERVAAVAVMNSMHYGEVGPLNKKIWRIFDKATGKVIRQSPEAERYYAEHPEDLDQR